MTPETPPLVPAGATPHSGPRCPGCGSDLSSGLAHTTVPSRGPGESSQALVVAYCPSCGAPIGITAPPPSAR